MTLSKDEILDSIASMSVLDLVDLISAIEEKFGVTAAAAAPVAVLADAGAGAAVEEKTTFTVTLKSAGEKKVPVIRAVRSVTGLGLKEAKDLVDGAPKALKEDVTKEEAEAVKKEIEEAGGEVEIG